MIFNIYRKAVWWVPNDLLRIWILIFKCLNTVSLACRNTFKAYLSFSKGICSCDIVHIINDELDHFQTNNSKLKMSKNNLGSELIRIHNTTARQVKTLHN